jgi:SPP1 family predicted phage head-tail adaptor
MTIDAGKLRHRVQIQEQVVVQDSAGAIVVSWQDFGSAMWAEIAPLSAREFVQSASDQNRVTARITVRYRDGIRPSMRVVHGSKFYNITGVLPDVDSGLEYLTLPVTTGVNNGE